MAFIFNVSFRIKLIIILTLFNNYVLAQAPKYSNEFLAIGIGARSLAMANANVATVNDVTATYWNPSGLTLIHNDLQLGIMHTEYFAGIAKFDYLGGASKLNDSSSFGVSIIRFGVDDIPNTLDLFDSDGNIRYDRIKSFSDAEYSFLFSYARKSKIEKLRYGCNVKIIHKKIGDFATVWGFGFDIGAQYKFKNWHFGAMGRDITSTFNAWSFNNSDKLIEVFEATGNEIPVNSLEITLPKLILGAARNFNISEKFSCLIELDADITFDKTRNVLIKGDPISIDPHLGVEINYKNLIYFRFGAMNFQQIPDFDGKNIFSFQPNMGLGIKIKNLAIDYALTDIGDQSIALYSNVFSIRYSIDKK